MRISRRARLALLVPVVVVGLGSGPALAAASAPAAGRAGDAGSALAAVTAPRPDGQITSPGDGAVVRAGSVEMGASAAARTGTWTLTLLQPDGRSRTVGTGATDLLNGTETSYSLQTSCWSVSGGCTAPAPNGSWRVRWGNGTMRDERSFALEVPPAAPAGGTSTVAGRQVQLSWQRGTEPDLVGYRVEGAGQSRQLDLGACSGATCRTSLTPGPEVSGPQSFRVLSQRACPTCDSQAPLTSQPSSTTATVPGSAPAKTGTPRSSAPPAGSAAPAASGSPSPAAGATVTPGASSAPVPGADQQGANRLLGSGSSGLLSGLSPLVQGGQQATAVGPAPAVAPVPDTFAPTLGYAPQTRVEQVPVPPSPIPAAATGPTTAVTTGTGGPAVTSDLLRGLAGALVLLAVGAHLRRWLRSART